MNNIIKNKNFILASLLFLLTMSVYLFTLAPTITMEDSGELVAGAATLGIVHPSGYPLWTIIAWLFTKIPLGTIAWRVNLLSAVFGALTIVLLYLVIEKFSKNKPVAFFCPLILAFSATFWQQSVTAKFYTLNSFFTVLLIFILLVWAEKKQDKYLYWFALLYGLSLSNHTMMLLIAPAYAAFILWNNPRIICRGKLIFKMFVLCLLGLAVYFYLPLRAFQWPDFNWGPITTWSGVLRHITRSQYGDFVPSLMSYSKVGLVLSFLVEISRQFFAPTLLLALGGGVYLWLKNRPLAALTTGIFLFNSLGIIFLRNFGMNLNIVYAYRVYYLPAFCVVIIWLAAILTYLYEFLAAAFRQRPVWVFRAIEIVLLIVLVSLPLSFCLTNYETDNYSNFWLNYDYCKNLLASLEPNSVYFFIYDGSLQGDSEIFSLAYLQTVEHFRPDVDIVSEQNLFYKKLVFLFPVQYLSSSFPQRQTTVFNLLSQIKNRPLYTNFAYVGESAPMAAPASAAKPLLVVGENNFFAAKLSPLQKTDFFTVSNGYAFKVFSDIKAAKIASIPASLASVRNVAAVDYTADAPTAGLAAHYFYNLAFFFLSRGDEAMAKQFLSRAVSLNPDKINFEYRLYLDYRRQWLGIK